MKAPLIALALLAACSSPSGGADGGTTSNLDGSGQLACQGFHTLAADIELTTIPEERAAAQDIWDDAQYSDSIPLRDAAHDMLEALTSGDNDLLRNAVARMAIVC